MTGVGIRSFEAMEYNRREILRYALCPQTVDDATNAVMEECIRECDASASFSYRVSYITLPLVSLERESGDLDLGHIRLCSKDLAKNLDGCRQVLLFAATIGPGIDRLIRKYSKLDPARALFMQAIGAERAESLCNSFCSNFPGQLRPRFSPGFGDLPLSIQPEVLRLTNATKNLSITLDEGFLMSPTKSVTAFAGICDSAG